MLKKEYINIHILIYGKDLMKHCYQTKNNFTVAYTWKTLQMLIIMQKEYGKILK